MKRFIFAAAVLLAARGVACAQRDTTSHALDNVVVTGTRSVTDVRHLPMTISVVDRRTLTESQRVNVLPTLSEQVPGLFVTSRSMMGYAVSDGAAGGISLRGLGSGAGRMMVLIDGHPQYQGIFGHSIADSYQTMMAERVEVLRGPASVLYGSNAMGGVVNIVTRQMRADGSLLRHVSRRVYQPREEGRLLQRCCRTVRPQRQQPAIDGLRAVRRLPEVGLRLLAALDSIR